MSENTQISSTNLNTTSNEENKAKIIHEGGATSVPKVSIIVPVFNLSEYLSESLDSMLNQDFHNFEIIAVDDGSTDNSLDILLDYASKDKRITVMSQKNCYAGVARNTGLSIAKGEYLLFLDGDDFFEPNLLSYVTKVMDSERSNVSVFQYKYFNTQTNCDEPENKGINKKLNKNGEEHILVDTASIASELFTLVNPMPWNKMFRASFVKEHNLKFQNLILSNDVFFSDTALSLTDKISFIYKTFVHYRYNNNSSLRNKRDEYPYCFYECYCSLHDFLEKHQIYEKYKKTFLNSFVSTINFTIEKTFLKRNEVKLFVKHEVVPKYLQNEEDLALIKASYLEKLKKYGVMDLNIPEPVISITSFPARIATVNQTIESIINQNYPYKCITLWLADSQFPNKEKDLPESLIKLKDAKSLCIGWCEDTKSYKKLIPSLKKYPNDAIITIDDDLIYPVDWLERLVCAYMNDKSSIHTMRAHGIKIDSLLHIQPYANWMSNMDCAEKSYFNFFTGVGGVLYPPKTLSDNVLNEKQMLKLCPNADDIWFWANAILNRTKINLVTPNIGPLNYVPGSQDGDIPLWKVNVTMGLNDLHMSNLLKKYTEVISILIEEITDASHCTKCFGLIHVIYGKKQMLLYKKITLLGVNIYFRVSSKNKTVLKIPFMHFTRIH